MKNLIKKIYSICIIAAFLFVSSCGLGEDIPLSSIVSPSKTSEKINFTPEPTSTVSNESATPAPPEYTEYTEITIGSVGDIMCHKLMLMDAQNAAENDWEFTTNGDESYSFDHWFQFVKPYTEYPDLMIGNLETTITLDNSLASGYPFFATPKEILPALKNIGFDVLLNGNNHILDKEQTGLISTIQALDDEPIYHTGAWASADSKNIPLVINVEGVQIGIVSATCSVNDQDLQLSAEENEYMYTKTDNLSDISNQINLCKDAGAEFIVLCPHWGYEYATRPNLIIRNLAEEYIKLGADVILAHHPHVLQPVETVNVVLENEETRQGLIFWSLGNFISNQMNEMEYLSGAIAYITIRKNNATGEINIVSSSYVPIWTYIQYYNKTNTKVYSILPVGQVIDDFETISSINPSNISNALNESWKLITNRLGDTEAQPLRLVPEKNADTTY